MLCSLLLKALSHWRRRRRDYRDWSVAATRATREIKNSLRSHQWKRRRRRDCSLSIIPRSTTRSIIRWCQHTLSHVITKVGQTASSSVAEKSPQRLLSLQQVSERSRRRLLSLQQVSETSRRRRGDVSATCWRLREVSKKIEHVWFFCDSPETRLVSRRRRGDVAETSPQPAETRVAN